MDTDCALCRGSGICPDCDGPCDLCAAGPCAHGILSKVASIFRSALIFVGLGAVLLLCGEYVGAGLLMVAGILLAWVCDRIAPRPK